MIIKINLMLPSGMEGRTFLQIVLAYFCLCVVRAVMWSVNLSVCSVYNGSQGSQKSVTDFLH